MKNKITKKTKSTATTNVKKGKKNPLKLEEDSFFKHDSKRRKKFESDNGIIESSDSDDNPVEDDEEEKKYGKEGEEEDEFANETADEKKHRVAKGFLENIQRIAKKKKEDGDSDDGEEDSDDEDDEKTGAKVTELLQQKQLEASDRVRQLIASRVQKPESHDRFELLVRHSQTVTSLALADDDLTGFSASKDGSIIQWDVESGKVGKYMWPSKEILSSHGAKNPQNSAKKGSKHVLSIAVSSDGRYLATGGLDRHVHLWDTRTRQHIQAFPGHRGPVSCLTFRQGSSQLISGAYDRQIKLWNVEDRAYMDTLFGHQGEVLTVDCLRKERVLSVGRDRSMRLFKIAEESQLVFRAPAASLECCCFISNDEFLSGSDDGSVELWNTMRKKPAFIVKNAHPKDNRMANGDDTENGNIKAEGHCSSAQSWVGSVAVCRSSDLAASGAGNGTVRLWSVDGEAKTMQPLHDLPLVGFVNSLAFAKSGRFLLAGVGQRTCTVSNGASPSSFHFDCFNTCVKCGNPIFPVCDADQDVPSFGSASIPRGELTPVTLWGRTLLANMASLEKDDPAQRRRVGPEQQRHVEMVDTEEPCSSYYPDDYSTLIDSYPDYNPTLMDISNIEYKKETTVVMSEKEKQEELMNEQIRKWTEESKKANEKYRREIGLPVDAST